MSDQITGAEIYIIRNERLTVTNGHDQPVFEVDSCHGVTKIGNTFRRADFSLQIFLSIGDGLQIFEAVDQTG